MILPISVERAFVNAEKEQQINTNDISQTKIHMCFKRNDIGYKNTYYILTGTRQEIETYINMEKLHKKLEKESSHCMTDDYKFIETPFETYCNYSCIYLHDDPLCENSEEDKCCSNWVSSEFNNYVELEKYIKIIPHDYSYYNKYHIIYMDNSETYESVTKASYSINR